MTNARLLAALKAAHLTKIQFAEKVGVDPKTVSRWMAGRGPQEHYRFIAGEVLREDPDYLWPGDQPLSGAQVIAEVVDAHAHRADLASDVWWQLLTTANAEISLLAYAMHFLPEQHSGLSRLLREKGASGCRVRIVLGDPACPAVLARDEEEQMGGALSARIRTTLLYFRSLFGCPGVELRFQTAPLYNSIFRFDDQILFTPHLFGKPGSSSPLFHLRRTGAYGMFDNLASHLESLWETTTPIPPPPPRPPGRRP
ncbi:MAG: helix-turn-helix domain-containing protein [Candidatus Dormibacteria bacterium]